MAMSRASNVLLAKCRCKYGRRLTHADVEALLECRTVYEIAAYLKTTQRYGPRLSRIDDRSIDRRRVESELYKQLYDDMASLGRYELSLGDWLGKYILMKGEIRQLLEYLRLLAAGRPGEYIFALPSFFARKGTGLDLIGLSQAKNYSEFLHMIEGSRYYKILKNFTPADGVSFEYTLIEVALYGLMYDALFNIINKHFSSTEQEELLDFMGTFVDMENFGHLYRLKRFYAAEPDTVRSMMYHHQHKIPRLVMRDLINAPDSASALKLFISRTPYGRFIDEESVLNNYMSETVNFIMNKKALRILRFSLNPSAVLLAYMQLAEAEIRDLITIIEGIRYSLPPDEIARLIIIDSFS